MNFTDMNYTKIAAEAGISRNHLYKILRGKTNPSFKVVEAIARVLNCNTSEVLSFRKIFKGKNLEKKIKEGSE